jgi:hypothetical protein
MRRKMTDEMAFLMARELMGIVGNCLRPDEHRAAFEEFYEVCKRGLRAHDTLTDETHTRLGPSIN